MENFIFCAVKIPGFEKPLFRNGKTSNIENKSKEIFILTSKLNTLDYILINWIKYNGHHLNWQLDIIPVGCNNGCYFSFAKYLFNDTGILIYSSFEIVFTNGHLIFLYGMFFLFQIHQDPNFFVNGSNLHKWILQKSLYSPPEKICIKYLW